MNEQKHTLEIRITIQQFLSLEINPGTFCWWERGEEVETGQWGRKEGRERGREKKNKGRMIGREGYQRERRWVKDGLWMERMVEEVENASESSMSMALWSEECLCLASYPLTSLMCMPWLIWEYNVSVSLRVAQGFDVFCFRRFQCFCFQGLLLRLLQVELVSCHLAWGMCVYILGGLCCW